MDDIERLVQTRAVPALEYMRSVDDHGNVLGFRIILQCSENREAVEVRHRQIEHDEVRSAFASQAQPFASAMRLEEPVTPVGQKAFNQVSRNLVIVDNQNFAELARNRSQQLVQ